jgi:hypothetical protein
LSQGVQRANLKLLAPRLRVTIKGVVGVSAWQAYPSSLLLLKEEGISSNKLKVQLISHQPTKSSM